MRRNVKISVVLLALLLSAAGAASAWADESPASLQAAASPGGEEALLSPTGTGLEQTAAAVEPSDAAAEGFESYDSSEIETVKPSYNPFDWLVYKPLWALTGWIGDFNPIGKHVADPLEQAVPGLRFKGFINSITQINLTGTDHYAGLGGRNKDWRLQKQEIRTQLEFKYQITDQLEAVSVNNFLWDGAYALQSSDGLYKDGSINQEYYQEGRRIFREAYVRGNYGKINFTLGKQIVNWGKMDGKVIDIVNGSDGRDVVDFHIGDYEWRAIGQWMALFSFRPVENTTVSLLWNPDFQPNTGPAAGSPYWYPFSPSAPAGTPLTREIKPSGFDHLADSEAGIRVDTTIGGLSLSGIYYYGFDRDGVYYRSDNSIHHPRIDRFGYALDYGTSIFGQRLIIRSEGLYTSGKSFNTSDPFAIGGIVKKDVLKLALAFETSVGSAENKVDILYQPQWTHQLGYDARTGAVRNDLLHVISLSHSVRATSDKLSLGATFYVNAGGSSFGGWAGTYTAGWKFNDYLKATLAYNDYQGDNYDIPWGAYHKWRNLTLDVKYEW